MKLCRECGAALLSKCLCRSLLAALCGFLLGTGLTSLWHWSARASLGLSLSTSYVSWSLFWGWHYGTRTWQRVYARLQHWFQIEALALSLLLFIRVGAALVVGICGGGSLRTWQAIRMLRRG